MKYGEVMHAQSGVTLLELLITVVIVAILATVALPSYQDSVMQTRAKTATTDLIALSLTLENTRQRTLTYPTVTTTTTAETQTAASGWQPAQSEHFRYSLIATSSGYTLSATGIGSLDGCVLTVNQDNVRSQTSSCGISSW
ncbi:type IV pilin protein [Ferrimonas marina]|uniref:Type IV pilus assembly protein PilE n=1 Tax=Ferrimonas marina TaxID=299255 RepID=A0A1M5NYR0_9GAMM|nr:type IV pilin protein [Ferrimonas marina]SHG94628.1 type IV pilus assembly protein PilE [Ferrimonas marina]